MNDLIYIYVVLSLEGIVFFYEALPLKLQSQETTLLSYLKMEQRV